ncbi:MAG: FkbM family methyltransferase [Proteobacteria bacterium]|nr:FkbM family methyltransferase [Pseudomonadota bacterium]
MNIYKHRVLSYLFWKYILKSPRLRLFLTKLLVPDETITVDILSVPVAINKRKEIGYWRAYKAQFNNVLFRDEIGPLISLCLLAGEADTFVDIGANVGLYSAVIGKLQSIYPSIKVYAFEPNLDTCARLRQTLSSRKAQIEAVALSNKTGELEFVSGATSGVFGVHASHFQDPGRRQKVRCDKLDNFHIEGDSLIIKIDVEGHEREVLEGARETITSGRVKAIYVDGYADENVPDLLEKAGFRLLEGRGLRPFEKGDHSLLAVRMAKA